MLFTSGGSAMKRASPIMRIKNAFTIRTVYSYSWVSVELFETQTCY